MRAWGKHAFCHTVQTDAETKETFGKAIDPTIDLDEEALSSASTVAELASQCCARVPYQRPDMGHIVKCKPDESYLDNCYGIDIDMSLPQALKRWKEFEGTTQVGSTSSWRLR